ncbi:1-deoxy-D-xylulose-5-phosphate synthase [bioreactor metagenome]|uniref:1-deoxy-D-xylulose-5-phosphate synthase n=1 Tax=bioreactor metagenome TaxID=1076179 RepID=A0A644ZSG5_9ZZZZ
MIQKVQTNNLNYAVVNARFIKPFDEAMLLRIASTEKPIFTYEIDLLKGGLSSAIDEFFCDHQLCVAVYRSGIDNQYVTHGSNVELKKALKLDINTFVNYITKVLSERR